jgi:hypothetical protein
LAKQETNMKQASSIACCQLHGDFLLGVLLDPEDGDMFLRNVG